MPGSCGVLWASGPRGHRPGGAPARSSPGTPPVSAAAPLTEALDMAREKGRRWRAGRREERSGLGVEGCAGGVLLDRLDAVLSRGLGAVALARRDDLAVAGLE